MDQLTPCTGEVARAWGRGTGAGGVRQGMGGALGKRAGSPGRGGSGGGSTHPPWGELIMG